MAVQIIRGLVAATMIIAACPAHGEEEPVCGVLDLSMNPVITLGHIAGSARVHFLKDPTVPGCPSSTSACTERAYVVPGDRVFVSIRRDSFVCATFVDSKGDDHSGWVAADAVVYDKQEPVTLAGWVGKWSRHDEADIRVKPGKGGILEVEGDATFGARDPARVKRGAVNSGEISAEVTPAGDRLSFAESENGTLPVDQGGEFSCRVWMRRVGPWLLVYDNKNCGGFRVTFRGIYIRKP